MNFSQLSAKPALCVLHDNVFHTSCTSATSATGITDIYGTPSFELQSRFFQICAANLFAQTGGALHLEYAWTCGKLEYCTSSVEPKGWRTQRDWIWFDSYMQVMNECSSFPCRSTSCTFLSELHCSAGFIGTYMFLSWQMTLKMRKLHGNVLAELKLLRMRKMSSEEITRAKNVHNWTVGCHQNNKLSNHPQTLWQAICPPDRSNIIYTKRRTLHLQKDQKLFLHITITTKAQKCKDNWFEKPFVFRPF